MKHEEFVSRLKIRDPSIEVLGTYTGSQNRILVRCAVDGHEWNPQTTEVLNRSGCPKCAGNITKTTQEFVEELRVVAPDIIVLGCYVNKATPILVRCAIDGHEWSPLPNNLLVGHGCPKCYIKRHRKANEDFLGQINYRQDLIPLDDYVTSGAKIRFRCINGHEWSAIPNSILQGGGCPHCYGHIRKTHDEFIIEMRTKHPDISVLGVYKNTMTKITAQCNLDGHVWSPIPNDLHKGHGCPKCAGVAKKTHAEYVQDVKDCNAGIEVIGEYVNDSSKIQLRCLKDGHIWSPAAGSILQGQGCPKCSVGGYKPFKDGWFYLYDLGEAYGFGITNNLKSRKTDHSKVFRRHQVHAKFLGSFSGDGQYILEVESYFKKNLQIYDTGLTGFRTEAVLKENSLELIVWWKQLLLEGKIEESEEEGKYEWVEV